jgi:hypothetical protein
MGSNLLGAARWGQETEPSWKNERGYETKRGWRVDSTCLSTVASVRESSGGRLCPTSVNWPGPLD